MLQRIVALFVGIILFIVLLAFMPSVLDSIHDAQVDSQTDAGLACTETPMDVVLTEDLWKANINSVTSAFDDQDNVLTATAYVEATKTLTVTGWVTPATTCTIIYETDALVDFMGAGLVMGLMPLGYIAALIITIGGSIWGGIGVRRGVIG
ncbi:hypothetical protein ES703_11113 [subsurface metagenome]